LLSEDSAIFRNIFGWPKDCGGLEHGFQLYLAVANFIDQVPSLFSLYKFLDFLHPIYE
jgi:hypothetical protein